MAMACICWTETNDPLWGFSRSIRERPDLQGSCPHGTGTRCTRCACNSLGLRKRRSCSPGSKRERPELYRAARTVLLCKDFITHRLTGVRVSEISDMSGCGLLRMPDCAYDDALLALYGLEDAREKLPRLIDPADSAGRVTARAAGGLAEGTPVCGGLIDVVSSALGSGVSRPGQASIILGTWSINQVLSGEPLVNPDMFMVASFGAGRYVNIEASATSAANLEWYVRVFIERGTHCDAPFEYANASVAEVKPKRDDPYFHPFLFGSGQGAEFRAGFYGLAGWHGEGHLLRALFEGVVFEHRRHIEVLARAGITIDRAALSGGGSRSPHWPQMMADALGVPITLAECQETGALGAANRGGSRRGHLCGLRGRRDRDDEGPSGI